jgi:TonB-dependent SusC/RagA subfamily outer membrane receptor
MLTTSNTPKYAYLRKVAVLPLVAITLVLFSIQLSAQKPKPKKELATQYTVTMRPDSTTFSDPKTGKKVFSVATRDMPPPPPPAGAPGVPVPPSDLKNVVESAKTNLPDKKATSSDVIYTVVEEVKGDKSSEILLVSQETADNNPEKKISIDFKKGKPLIVIDGVITSEINLNDLNPNKIQSMNVLKGEKATSKYAEKGANGVVEITTKKP